MTRFRLEVPHSSSDVDLSCRIKADYTNSVEYASFLTVKTSSGPIRYWARLKGDKIKFWKYPEDVEEGKKCEEMISLYHILNKDVALLKGRGSARPNTVELYGKDPKKSKRPEDVSSTLGKVYNSYTHL